MGIDPRVFAPINMSHVDIPDGEESNKTIVECFKKVMDHVPESAKKEIEILKKKNEILNDYLEHMYRIIKFCLANNREVNLFAEECWIYAAKNMLENVQGT